MSYMPVLLAPLVLLLVLLGFLISAAVSGALQAAAPLRDEIGARDVALLSPLRDAGRCRRCCRWSRR